MQILKGKNVKIFCLILVFHLSETSKSVSSFLFFLFKLKPIIEITKPGNGPKTSAVMKGIKISKFASAITIHDPKPKNITEKINDKSRSSLEEFIAKHLNEQKNVCLVLQ